MKKNLLYIIAVLSVLVSCTEEKMEVGTPLTGQDVKFSVSMGNNSRTIYGAEETDKDGNKSIKVNWVNGDKITVFGTTCSVQQADYSVVANTANQNYADDLVKTGAAGVQWGSEPSVFYAVYPAVGEDAFEIIDGAVAVTTSIREQQNNSFKLEGDTWKGTPYVVGYTTGTMCDALMYARTLEVESTDNNGVVDLNFKPFSTVLKFKLDGFTVINNTTNQVVSDAKVYINSITLRAPSEYAVAGECSFKFDAEIPTVEGGTSSKIVIYPDRLVISQGQKIEFCAYAVPNAYTMTKGEPWLVEVETSNYGTLTFKIEPESPQNLLAGQIHKINIPAYSMNRGEVTLPANEWMKWIPRNVYLSELSMPGAWYCMDSGYQGNASDGTTATLENLYNAGVRAFNIDCRITRNKFSQSIISGTTVWTDDNYKNGEFHFACAGTETPTNYGVYYGINEGTHVKTAVQKLVALANENPHEIIAIVFTFAEKPCTENFVGTMRFGTTDPGYITAELKKVLEDSSISPYLYKNVTAETTISDLLTVPEGAQYPRNILVKINHSNNQFYSNYALPEGIMTSFGSMAMSDWSSNYISSISSLDSDYYSMIQEFPIYNGGGNTIANTKLNDMTYYYHQAQKTYGSGGTPTVEQREKAIDDVLAKAKTIYDNSHHNALFQLGIGGSLDENTTNIASSLNNYVQDKIEAMINNTSENKISPLGFVLMNHCLSYTSFIQDIISFNAKFFLNRDANKEEWPAGLGDNPYNSNNGDDLGNS